MKVIREKECYCKKCRKKFHYLGITRHRAMHRDKREDVTIIFTWGNQATYRYSEIKEGEETDGGVYNW